MLESIVFGLGVHLSKKLIDQMWGSVQSGKPTVIDSAGEVRSLATPSRRPKVTHVPGAEPAGMQTLQGRVFIEDSLRVALTGEEATFVMLIEEMQQEVFALFQVDAAAGFEISLPHGVYSLYSLIVDNDALDFFDTTILGVGFPTREDTSGAAQLKWRSEQEMCDSVRDAPIRIGPHGPYSLDLLVLDSSRVPDMPATFAELTGDTGDEIDLADDWIVEGESHFGAHEATTQLVQSGLNLRGIVLNRDIGTDGSRWISRFELHGMRLQVLPGPSREYNLNSWRGTIRDADTITGTTRDAAGVRGAFVMRRA